MNIFDKAFGKSDKERPQPTTNDHDQTRPATTNDHVPAGSNSLESVENRASDHERPRENSERPRTTTTSRAENSERPRTTTAREGQRPQSTTSQLGESMHLRVSEDTYRALQELAADEGVPIAAVARRAIREWLAGGREIAQECAMSVERRRQDAEYQKRRDFTMGFAGPGDNPS